VREVEVTAGSLSNNPLKPNWIGDYTNIPLPAVTIKIGYGVEVNPTTGVLSGYAWTGGGIENGVNKTTFGWISFNSGEIGACPVAPCQAKIDINTFQFSGWARACSVFQSGCSGALKPDLGGWDGWIRLKDGLYGVLLNNATTPPESYQWAWGDKVNIGWISFSNSNMGSPNAYKVQVDLTRPPVAIFTCNKTPCQTYQGDADLSFINASTDPDGVSDIASSQWWTKLKTDPDTNYVSQLLCSAAPILCNYTVNTAILTPSRSHTVKLRVTDKKALYSEATMDFYILKDVVASFNCSLDGSTWVACSTITPLEGDKFYVDDTSTPSEGAAGISSRVWNVAGTTGQDQEQIIATAPNMAITLTVTDTNGRTDSVTQTVMGVMPLPVWKEITPF